MLLFPQGKRGKITLGSLPRSSTEESQEANQERPFTEEAEHRS